jgi:hypothetical protein
LWQYFPCLLKKLEMLRSWGDGLLKEGRDELRAAGRAISMLVEEIEQMNVDLWHARQDIAKERRFSALSPGSPGGSCSGLRDRWPRSRSMSCCGGGLAAVDCDLLASAFAQLSCALGRLRGLLALTGGS